MKNLQFNSYQCGAGQSRLGLKRLNPSPPHGARLKSRPISTPPPLRDGENPCGIKRGEAKLPSPKNTIYHYGIHNIDKRP